MEAILDEIREVNATGRPILVGTTSIEKSEELAGMLKRYGIPHQVLNAKYHEREAEIVAQAGRREAVTIATNMAGRGTDIILGGNPEFMAWADLKRLTDEDARPLYQTRLDVSKEAWEEAVRRYEPEMKVEGREVAAVGGLHIIGTERHESRRIDNQLRGRAGRQGDPGSSRFFLSLEDDLMRKFAGEWVSAVLTRLGMQEGEAIESKMVSRRIEGAQKKVEERNFDIRKNLLEYDEVMDQQRKRVYSFRQSLLEGAPPKEMILEMVDKQIEDSGRRFLADDYGAATFAEVTGQALGVELTARDIKGASFEDAVELAKAKAERQLSDTIRQAIEENLPADAETSEWTWQALLNWVNNRFGLKLTEKELRKIAITDEEEFRSGHDDLEEFLTERAAESIQNIDLSKANEFLQPDWGKRTLAGWVHHKFTLPIDPASWADLDRAEIVRRVQAQARELYAQKEAELPLQIALRRFLSDRTQSQTPRYDRDGLAAWVQERYQTHVDPDELRPLLRSQIEAKLIEHAHQSYQGAKVAVELESKLAAAKINPAHHDADSTPPTPAALAELADWANQELGLSTSAEKLGSMTPSEIRNTLLSAIDARYRPEMREMEKTVLLDILDSSWMEHLRTMDHLRSSIGLQGYAQIDPKVEYKREGMRIFGEMWNGIADRVTDLVFRVEQFDPQVLDELGSRWHLDRAQTIHHQAESQLSAPVQSSAGVRRQQDAAIAASERSTEKKREPVRNVGKKVGRNDPCPCGSGKKFKACCMRKQSMADPF